MPFWVFFFGHGLGCCLLPWDAAIISSVCLFVCLCLFLSISHSFPLLNQNRCPHDVCWYLFICGSEEESWQISYVLDKEHCSMLFFWQCKYCNEWLPCGVQLFSPSSLEATLYQWLSVTCLCGLLRWPETDEDTHWGQETAQVQVGTHGPARLVDITWAVWCFGNHGQGVIGLGYPAQLSAEKYVCVCVRTHARMHTQSLHFW